MKGNWLTNHEIQAFRLRCTSITTTINDMEIELGSGYFCPPFQCCFAFWIVINITVEYCVTQ